MAETTGEMKQTLGLTGLTMNAMALIAPGAFLWLTFAGAQLIVRRRALGFQCGVPRLPPNRARTFRVDHHRYRHTRRPGCRQRLFARDACAIVRSEVLACRWSLGKVSLGGMLMKGTEYKFAVDRV